MVQEIPLATRKGYAGLVALVDDEDEYLVADTPTVWIPHVYQCKHGRIQFWAQRNRQRRNGKYVYPFELFMHRLIVNAPKGMEVDHINGNGLDNRRCNLRIASPSENQQNRQTKKLGTHSRFKGVTWHRNAQKWQAGIKKEGRSIHLGLFEAEVDAAIAYNHAAIQMFGEFAHINSLEAA